MNPKSMWGALIKAQVRDGFYVFHTCDKESSVQLILYLQKQLASDGFDSVASSRVISGLGQKRKRENLNDASSMLLAMLTVIPGISKLKAQSIMEQFSSIASLQKSTAVDLSNVMCGKRRLGMSAADTIKTVFYD